jgi:hypothetical protein
VDTGHAYIAFALRLMLEATAICIYRVKFATNLIKNATTAHDSLTKGFVVKSENYIRLYTRSLS